MQLFSADAMIFSISFYYYFLCGCKGLVFCRNNGKHGQGTHCTKMDTDSLAENTTNAPESICPIPKVLDFNDKRLHWTSVIRASGHFLERSVGPKVAQTQIAK